jgi:uncharacterized RDD family membrane protein YckC
MKPTGTDSFTPPELSAPSISRRMACWLYEGMLLFGVTVTAGLAYFISAYWLTGLGPGDMKLHPPLKSGLQAISFFVLGLYFTWMWHRGQTLAMKTWRIQIVNRQGGPLDRQTAFKRYLLSWVWFLPPFFLSAVLKLGALEVTGLTLAWITLWAWLSRLRSDRQFWHDAWTGTRLIALS